MGEQGSGVRGQGSIYDEDTGQILGWRVNTAIIF
jgi:hypothetical protein